MYSNDIEKITSWDRPVAIAAPAVTTQLGSALCVDKGKSHVAAIALGPH